MADELPALTAFEGEAILRRLAGPFIDYGAPRVRSAAAANGSTHPEPSRPLVAPPAPVPLSTATLIELLEAVPDALVIIDSLGRIAFVNGETERLFGYRRDELLGREIELLVPERLRPGHVAQRDSFLAAPRIRPIGQGLELTGQHKDGHEVAVEISLSPLQTDGRVLVVASIRDVADRRKSEGQLRKVEKRYRTLVEGIPAVTFMAPMDQGPGEIYVSPQIEELLGFSQKEWLENPILWYSQLHPDDQGRWHAEFARTISAGEPFRSVYRFIARDGRVVWVHGEAQVVRDDDGQPLFLQGVAFDVTGIKEVEERLKTLNAGLEERVAVRTAELERSNTALKEFAGVAAHDLKEPLRTMQSKIHQIADRLSKELPDHVVPAIDDAIAKGLKAGGRMKTLIDDLFAFAKVRMEGKEVAPVACRDALAAALESLEIRIAETAAVIVIDELPTVLADVSQLAQLFQNLISNSLKFREQGQPPRIRVSFSSQDSALVTIRVTDNGIGIEPRALAKVFKLGVESRQHGRDKYPGSGIGLTTCERIVERHGGRIWAESDGLGRGTTIAFTVPVAS
ncbi:MAG TPA: PAS domain S-box protein [Urbifossiella sp.]|nr:PAS domain S-box protein [Urbifossiella sp.]